MRVCDNDDLESVACDFCKSDEASLKYTRADGLTVTECSICGLAYLNPRPKNDIIEHFYDQDYFTGVSANSGLGGLKCEVAHDRSKPHKAASPRPIKLLSDNFGGVRNKAILEIGCATGDLLAALKEGGAIVRGIEYSRYAAEVARERGLDVTVGTLEDYAASDELFDIIVAFEVIEHVLSPMRFLLKTSSLVRTNGLLLLSTPNYSGAHRHHSDWAGFNYSFEHIYFFSLDVLKRMAFKAGFDLLYWESTIDPTGPPYARNYFYKQINKISILSTLIVEIGFFRTLDLVFWKRSPLFIPFGNGRTLTLVLRKMDLFR